MEKMRFGKPFHKMLFFNLIILYKGNNHFLAEAVICKQAELKTE
jgi:hypothetical protein